MSFMSSKPGSLECSPLGLILPRARFLSLAFLDLKYVTRGLFRFELL